MVFSDGAFVFIFLPLALLALLAVRDSFAVGAFIFSLLFYMWSSGAYALILLGNVALNYRGGLALQSQTSPRSRKAMLAGLICANLAPLLYFKYAYFFLSQMFLLPEAGPVSAALRLAAPVGVSFFVFQGVSYVADVYAGRIQAEKNFAVFAAYATFFPHLAAGPIVRFADVAADFREPRRNIDSFAAGAARFAHGFIKKTLGADLLAPIADACFATDPASLSFADAWAGALAYSLQIYFDFSAYSDMAIGLALIFGVRFAENFLRPYASCSVTEFWRRWHVSLSSFFRDYVYIPLGGDRKGTLATYRNLLAVFVLTGLWHGANFTFLLWGLYHGAFLCFERLVWGSRARALNSFAMRLCYCLPAIIVGWVLFRSPTIAHAEGYLRAMFTPSAFVAPILTFKPLHAAVLLLASATLFLPEGDSMGLRLMERCERAPQQALRLAYMSVSLAAGGVLSLAQGYSPFLYFQF
jgi:alginate O-acetyltransferase complex protein AlgI